jgi:hypothetical protein
MRSAGGDPVPVVHQWESESELDLRMGDQERSDFDGVTIEGTEYLGAIECIPTSATLWEPTTSGEILVRFPLSPINLNGTRIRQLAEMYQRYKMEEVYIHLVPTTNALQAGSVIPVILYDPDASLTEFGAADERVRMIMSMYDSAMVNVYQPITVGAPGHFNDTLWTRAEDADARLVVPASFALVAASSYIPFSGTPEYLTLYNAYISYKIKFTVRGLMVPTPILASTNIGGAGTYDTYFYFGAATTIAAGSEVCMLLNVLATTYDTFQYVYEVIVYNSSGYTGWYDVTSTTLVNFQSDGSANEFNLTNGTPLYMFKLPNIVSGGGCFGFATNLTAALERRQDLFWGSNTVVDTGVDQIVWALHVRPITIS